jgi:hypothetical protein
MDTVIFKKKQIYCTHTQTHTNTHTVRAAYSRTIYKIVPLINLNNYLHNVTEVNVNTVANNSSEKL